MNQLLFLLALAAMFGTAIYLGHQGIILRRANKVLAGVVDDLQANHPLGSWTALAAAGDRLAHELLWEQNQSILGRWWELRGGHEACSICSPIIIPETILAGSQPTSTGNRDD